MKPGSGLLPQELRLDLSELDQNADAFDEEVAASSEIDQFCSSSFWVLPAAIELMPPRSPAITRGPQGWLAFMRGEHPGSGRYLEPLESSWGLACPLIGRDTSNLVQWFADVLERTRQDWDLTLLAGVPTGSLLLMNIAHHLGRRFRVLRHAQSARHLASLVGGQEGFLSRRSSNFRRSLQRSQVQARKAGLTFEHHWPTDVDEALALFARVQAVECTSWKGRDDVGIAAGSFGAFYRNMVPRLTRRQSLHVLFAKQGDKDVAFLLGGLFGDTFRGLQASFNESYRALGLGNLCQFEMLRRLPADVLFYDLGSSGLDYKARWAERTVTSEVLIVLAA
ncbi:MAG: GNAT family N-acetyltransferase [Deltaproteobacteria bacterium]|nr:GNAT family N-acetyltransferase [Deltaproteobacteria bacterium]